MSDIIRILYEYACTHQVPNYLKNEAAYQESDEIAKRNLEELRKMLPEEGRRKLDDYIGELELMNLFKLEAMFRAGLSIGQEISRL